MKGSWDRGRWFWLFAALPLVFGLGCNRDPVISDSSTVVVCPGYGATNLCAIGMTFKEVEGATRDADFIRFRSLSWSWQRLNPLQKKSGVVFVHSLSALAWVDRNQPLFEIEFYVAPHKQRLEQELNREVVEVREPFRGKLGNSLSFAKSPVTKAQVETAFGKPQLVATNSTEREALLRQTQPFEFRPGDDVAELWYRTEGVTFVLRSNVVTRFEVYQPMETGGPRSGSPRSADF